MYANILYLTPAAMFRSPSTLGLRGTFPALLTPQRGASRGLRRFISVVSGYFEHIVNVIKICRRIYVNTSLGHFSIDLICHLVVGLSYRAPTS